MEVLPHRHVEELVAVELVPAPQVCRHVQRQLHGHERDEYADREPGLVKAIAVNNNSPRAFTPEMTLRYMVASFVVP